MAELLPVHGFVLAGGKSSRMGRDKALLPFLGRPMVEIAVEKLRGICEVVSIVGEREDLRSFAPVVTGERADTGPGAGIEAGLSAAERDWCLFVPVDVPLVPAGMLRGWAEAVLAKGEAGCGASFWIVRKERQPAFCLVQKAGLQAVSASLDNGDLSLHDVLSGMAAGDLHWLWACNAEPFSPAKEPSAVEMEFWFSNLNLAEELEVAELWAKERESKESGR